MGTNNETKIVISATTAQAEAAMRKLGDSVSGVSNKFFDLSGAAGTLVGALTVTAFVGFIKQSIDAADRLDELSQITGTSVEALAGLKYAAEQNGATLETVARGGQKLSAVMADKPEIFKKLGISTSDSTEALIQLADIFALMPDGIEKSALATKLFGDRLGGEMILFLNQGTDAMRENIAAGQAYNPITKESAAQAARFNDNLNALQLSASGVGIGITVDLLPQMTKITEAMREAAKEGGILKTIWVGLGGLGAALFTDDMLPREQQITNRLEELRRWENNLKNSAVSRIFHPNDLRDTRAEIILLENELKALQKASADAVANPTEKTPEQAAAEIKKQREFQNKARQLLGDLGGGDKKKTDPNESALASIESEAFRKQMELLGVAPAQVKVYELAMKGATRAQLEAAQASAEQIIAIDAEIKTNKDAAKAAEDASKARIKAVDEANKLLGDIDPQVRANQEWQKLLDLQSAAIDENGRQILSNEDLGKAYKKVMEGIKNDGTDAFKNLEAAVRGWGNAFTDTLTQMVMTGKLNFKSLADSIIADLIRIQIQKNITDPLVKAGTSILDSFLNPSANANGNVYSGPGIGAYSSTVVDRPTLFPFARGVGLMGEAGPEAILPLKRINGRLGVQSDGAGSGVTVNIINQAGVRVTQQERSDQSGRVTLDVLLEPIEEHLARNVADGRGPLAGVLGHQFNVNRGAMAYR